MTDFASPYPADSRGYNANLFQKEEDRHRIQAHRTARIRDQDKRVTDLISDVPRLPPLIACLLCFCNIIFPGFGTLISAFVGKGGISKTQIAVAAFQLLLSVYIVGYIWSWYWGIKYVVNSGDRRSNDEKNNLMPAGQVRSEQPYNPYQVRD